MLEFRSNWLYQNFINEYDVVMSLKFHEKKNWFRDVTMMSFFFFSFAKGQNSFAKDNVNHAAVLWLCMFACMFVYVHLTEFIDNVEIEYIQLIKKTKQDKVI